MIRLDGYAAARFWGLGRKWCTTSSPTVYERYGSGGALIVLMMPIGRFQISTATGQFKDERDSPADPRMLSSGAPNEFMTRLHALLASVRPGRLPPLGDVRVYWRREL